MEFCCPQEVKELIANGVFKTDDEAWLVELPETAFKNVVAIANKKPEKVETAVTPTETITNAQVDDKASSKPDFNAILNAAPDDIRETILESVRIRNEKRDSLVNAIISAPGNRFTKEVLTNWKINDLEAVVALIPSKKTTADVFNYSMNAAGVKVNVQDEEKLDLPGLPDFSK